MNQKAKSYFQLLNSIYGREVVNYLTKSENDLIKLRDFRAKPEKIFNYKRDCIRECRHCESKLKISKKSFNNRTLYGNKIMKFPCWEPNSPLDFEREHVKNLMIIGIDL